MDHYFNVFVDTGKYVFGLFKVKLKIGDSTPYNFIGFDCIEGEEARSFAASFSQVADVNTYCGHIYRCEFFTSRRQKAMEPKSFVYFSKVMAACILDVEVRFFASLRLRGRESETFHFLSSQEEGSKTFHF